MMNTSALKQSSPHQNTDNTASLQRDIVKRDTPNDSGLNNLRTADYSIVGYDHLKR